MDISILGANASPIIDSATNSLDVLRGMGPYATPIAAVATIITFIFGILGIRRPSNQISQQGQRSGTSNVFLHLFAILSGIGIAFLYLVVSSKSAETSFINSIIIFLPLMVYHTKNFLEKKWLFLKVTASLFALVALIWVVVYAYNIINPR